MVGIGTDHQACIYEQTAYAFLSFTGALHTKQSFHGYALYGFVNVN